MDPATRVRELIEPALVSAGFELVDVEASSHLVRVTVDRAGGGIDLDAVSAASRLVSGLLDAHDPVRGDAYTLEVSSPGLERRLRTPE
ncbi:MAG TPA: ribosome maturation factor RimP, partial [Acidimicrobiales bacterium]